MTKNQGSGSKMEETSSKEENNLFQYLIELDKKCSSSLSLSASKSSPLGQYRAHMKFLEYSCHGAFWIPGAMIMLWFSDDPRKEAFFFNLLLALILDIIFVAILKAAIGRKRPENNDDDMLMTWSVDKMSCPSGHTSRAVMLTYLLIASSPNMYLLHPVLLVWCLCTCSSRVMLGRHHIGDVLIGVILGYIEYCIVDFVWAGPDTAKWYLDIFKDTNSVIDDL